MLRLKTLWPAKGAAAAKRPDNNNAITIWKRPGIAWPLRRFRSPCRTVEMLFRRRRQRDWLVRQRGQISNHVGALAVFLNTGKTHRGAGNKALRVADELVEVFKGPFAALRLHGGGEIEAALAFALLLIDGAKEVRADPVGAALFEGVAGAALLGGGSTLFGRGGLQQFFDRFGRCCGFGRPAMRLFLHRDLEARFFRHMGREHC